MNLIFLENPQSYDTISTTYENEVITIGRYGPPKNLVVDGRGIELHFQTRVALAIDMARTVGCDKIIFPFNNATEIKIAKELLRNYRDQGYFMDYQFPRKV